MNSGNAAGVSLSTTTKEAYVFFRNLQDGSSCRAERGTCYPCAAQDGVIERAHPKQAARVPVGPGPRRANRRQLSECVLLDPRRVLSHKANHTPTRGPEVVARGGGEMNMDGGLFNGV